MGTNKTAKKASRKVKKTALTPEQLEQLRAARRYRECYENYTWCQYRDETDIYDLRYLFDDEEIQEHKLELIEDFENQTMGMYPYTDEEEEENNRKCNAAYPEFDPQYADMEEENWDNDEWNVRFDMRLGFIYDDYDSGIDELCSRREEYPPLEVADDDEQEMRQRLSNLLKQRLLQRIEERKKV